MSASRIITLTTDFGDKDGFPAVMKGVILSIAPQATIVDISHEVPPYDVRSAAWLVARARPFFPEGTIHVAIVDPGVGSEQKRLAIETNGAVFLLPDNGMISLLLEEDEQFRAYVLDRPQFFLPEVSATFHGRDIFAPVAARLWLGAALETVASSIAPDLVTRLERPAVTNEGGTISGAVLYVDRFGNLITNIEADRLEPGQAIEVDGSEAGLVVENYASAKHGKTAGVRGSHGHLEIACFKGSASDSLNAKVGALVKVYSKG